MNWSKYRSSDLKRATTQIDRYHCNIVLITQSFTPSDANLEGLGDSLEVWKDQPAFLKNTVHQDCLEEKFFCQP